MKIFGYSSAKPSRIVNKVWIEGFKSLKCELPGLTAGEPRFEMLDSIDDVKAQISKDPNAKLVICATSSIQKRISGYMPTCQDYLKDLNISFKLGKNAQFKKIPRLANFALPTAPGIKDHFKNSEHATKRHRITLFLTPLSDFSSDPQLQRFVSYHDFIKWEIASFLDSQAPKFNIHVPTWDEDSNAEYDAQDIVMRMKLMHAVSFHKLQKFDDLVSLACNSSYLITDHRDLALMARSVGVNAVLLSDRYAFEDLDAAILGPGYFEPFTFSAETLHRRINLLNKWQDSPQILCSAKSTVEAELFGSNQFFES
jgi:hypothetical protein